MSETQNIQPSIGSANHAEIHRERTNPDPHFNRLIGLANLSQAALLGVIHALQAQEAAHHADATPGHNPEELLSHYIQSPEPPPEKHAA